MLEFVSVCSWYQISEEEIFNILKLPYDTRDNGRFEAVSQSHIQTLDVVEGQGRFTCSVTAVLGKVLLTINIIQMQVIYVM